MTLFKDKILMITGGTGSFGNAVLNRFLRTDIGEIRVFSRDEKKQDDMRHEFQSKMPNMAEKIRFYIGDVRDPASVKNAMHGVDYIFTGTIVLYFSVIMLLSGSRKTQVFGILAVALCYLYTYRPPKFKLYKKILIIIASIVFLNMIYVIRENRMNLSQVVPAFFTSLTNFDFLKNLMPEILAETGITFGSVASVMLCVPWIFPFEYGVPILRSVVSILPVGWLMPDFFVKASTTTTINSYLKLPVGASLFGDFYWNWGMFGIAFAFVFGMILAVGSMKLHKKSNEIYFSLFYIVLIGVRAGVFEIARPLFIVSIVPLLFSSIMSGRK